MAASVTIAPSNRPERVSAAEAARLWGAITGRPAPSVVVRALERSAARGRLLACDDGGAGIVAVARGGALRPGPRTLTGGRPSEVGAGGPTVRAWDGPTAARAARRRRREPDPHLALLVALAVTDGPTGAAVLDGLLDAAASAADEMDARRLDAVVPARGPWPGALQGRGWMVGRHGADVVASRLVALPWRRPSPVPPGASTSAVRRRLAVVRPRRVPTLAAMAVEEGVGRVRRGGATGPRVAGAAHAERGRHGYQAIRHRTIRRALSLVPAALRRTTFVDLGCGRGRSLQHAARLPFSRLVGVELDPRLADEARALNPDPRVQVVEADATTWALPDDAGVIYLFNPFGAPGMAAVARNLDASLRRRPRPILVVLANPRAVEPFTERGLHLVHADPQTALLAADPGGPAPR